VGSFGRDESIAQYGYLLRYQKRTGGIATSPDGADFYTFSAKFQRLWRAVLQSSRVRLEGVPANNCLVNWPRIEQDQSEYLPRLLPKSIKNCFLAGLLAGSWSQGQLLDSSIATLFQFGMIGTTEKVLLHQIPTGVIMEAQGFVIGARYYAVEKIATT